MLLNAVLLNGELIHACMPWIDKDLVVWLSCKRIDGDEEGINCPKMSVTHVGVGIINNTCISSVNCNRNNIII